MIGPRRTSATATTGVSAATAAGTLPPRGPAGVVAATVPPEARGLARDEVQLLVSDGGTHRHTRFTELAAALRAGDLLVVNDSATLPASLPARGRIGELLLNLSTRFGHGLWLAEPRPATDRPGPLPLRTGDVLEVAGLPARLVSPYPGEPRLWFVAIDAEAAMARVGSPIRYGYVQGAPPLDAYQTLFARAPGSAEMPSAGRPLSRRVLRSLARQGVRVAALTLHTGVSSLEVDANEVHYAVMPPEPFAVPLATAAAIAATRASGGRVVAVGTTVVRALESAWDGGRVAARSGFTRRVVHPGSGVRAVDGLLTGLHEPRSSHLALLRALVDADTLDAAYGAASAGGYLWHEFGDVHLILREPGA